MSAFDFEVGTDATSSSLLPGKDEATAGHHYVAIFPKNEHNTASASAGQETPGAKARTSPDEPQDASTNRRPSPASASADTTIRTHFPGSKEPKLKTDDQGIGAFRAAQPAEQKPTIGPKYTDTSPWAEPVTAADTLVGATSRDVHNTSRRDP